MGKAASYASRNTGQYNESPQGGYVPGATVRHCKSGESLGSRDPGTTGDSRIQLGTHLERNQGRLGVTTGWGADRKANKAQGII